MNSISSISVWDAICFLLGAWLSGFGLLIAACLLRVLLFASHPDGNLHFHFAGVYAVAARRAAFILFAFSAAASIGLAAICARRLVLLLK